MPARVIGVAEAVSLNALEVLQALINLTSPSSLNGSTVPAALGDVNAPLG